MLLEVFQATQATYEKNLLLWKFRSIDVEIAHWQGVGTQNIF